MYAAVLLPAVPSWKQCAGCCRGAPCSVTLVTVFYVKPSSAAAWTKSVQSNSHQEDVKMAAEQPDEQLRVASSGPPVT